MHKLILLTQYMQTILKKNNYNSQYYDYVYPYQLYCSDLFPTIRKTGLFFSIQEMII
ncbi:hypothetical protein ABIE50_000615 [Chitinophaga sp. OAE865]